MANFKTAEEGMKKHQFWTREKFKDSKYFSIEDGLLYSFEGSFGVRDIAKYLITTLESDDLIADDWVPFDGWKAPVEEVTQEEEKPKTGNIYLSPLAGFPILLTLTDLNKNMCLIDVSDISAVGVEQTRTIISFKSGNLLRVIETPEEISNILVDACTRLDNVTRSGKFSFGG